MGNNKVVVIICANSEWREVKGILSPSEVRMTAAGETCAGKAGEKEVTFLHSGWGKIAAAGGTQFAIDTFKPELIINLGTCGGFEGRIERGMILLATKTVVYDIVEQMGDADEAIRAYVTDIDPTGLVNEEKVTMVRGVLVSADRDLLPKDIPMLVEKYEALAADWESGAIAWTAKRNGVRVLILRGVSDMVSNEGGEAYGKIELFHERTRRVMEGLLQQLEVLLGDEVRV